MSRLLGQFNSTHLAHTGKTPVNRKLIWQQVI